jgi:hypothetical protein
VLEVKMKNKVWHSDNSIIKLSVFFNQVFLLFFVFARSAFADVILPGRCHMGECWDSKFVGKELIKKGNLGTLYLVTTASRSWQIDSQPPINFQNPTTQYVYCSTTKPAYIFKTEDGIYYAHLLNPGGDWYGYNQSDYPIYWATCHNIVGPNFFSEEMTARAKKLGYSTNLDSEQVELNNPIDILD